MILGIKPSQVVHPAAQPLLYIHDMRNLSVAACLFLAACTIGEDADPSGDDSTTDDSAADDNTTDDGTPDDGTPTGEGISGNITTSGTWTGTTVIGGGTTIAPGVTITVEPGTTIEFATAGANLRVDGTLLVNGTSASKVNIKARGTGFSGIVAGTGGNIDMKYAVQTGGALRMDMGSTVKITDTKLFKVSGDFLIMNGGALDMSYSQVGPGPGETDTTHCQLHFNAATSIKVTHSILNGAPYGLMFYGGTQADFTSNNWLTNGINVSTQPGVSGDFSNGYFDDDPPVSGAGATITANNLAAAPLADAGVRP